MQAASPTLATDEVKSLLRPLEEITGLLNPLRNAFDVYGNLIQMHAGEIAQAVLRMRARVDSFENQWQHAIKMITSKLIQSAWDSTTSALVIEHEVETSIDQDLQSCERREEFRRLVISFAHPRQTMSAAFHAAYSYVCLKKTLCAVCLSSLRGTTWCIFPCCTTRVCMDCADAIINQYVMQFKVQLPKCVCCYKEGDTGPMKTLVGNTHDLSIGHLIRIKLQERNSAPQDSRPQGSQ